MVSSLRKTERDKALTIWNELMSACECIAEAGYASEWDRMQELYADVKHMHKAWNAAEFDGKLATVPALPLLVPHMEVDETLTQENVLLGCFLPHALDAGAIFLGVPEAITRSWETGHTLYHHMAETLLHEMVHQYAHERGIEDVEADGTHNVAFRDVARAHGLVCHRGMQGWNKTFVRKGHWRAFYDLVPRDLARRMRTSHIPCGDMGM